MNITQILNAIALLLLVAAGLNWLLWGLLEINLVAALFGTLSSVSRAIYVLVGIAAIYTIAVAPGMVRGGTLSRRQF